MLRSNDLGSNLLSSAYYFKEIASLAYTYLYTIERQKNENTRKGLCPPRTSTGRYAKAREEGKCE
jgi:hypothetical protein